MAIYKDSQPITPIESITEAWEGKTGMEVEDFICSRLNSSISRFEFDQPNSNLVGYNAENKVISLTKVINSTPIYVPTLEIKHLKFNSINNDLKVNQDIELNYTNIEKVEVGIRFLVQYEILGTYYYAISPQDITFTLGDKKITARITPNSSNNPEAIQYVDITSLFQTGVSNKSLSAQCSIADQHCEDYYKGNITIKHITLSYQNLGYVEGTTVSFKIDGLLDPEKSKYRIKYIVNGTYTGDQQLSDASRVNLSLNPGVNQIYARIEYISNPEQFCSEWIQANVIVDCNNLSGDAVAVINSVPKQIHNCSNALLYKICYASGTNGGDIVINSYISDSWSDFSDLANTDLIPFNSTTISLEGGEKASEKEFYSYFELDSVADTDARYIGFTVNDNPVYSYVDDGTSTRNYFSVNIIENPYNINNAFNHVSGAELDYSQINGSGSNVFVADNLQLQPGDGWGIDASYTAFQVSASGQPLFKTPIDLRNYLNTGFTFEFLVNTYNVNGDDPILRIGNILLGPGYVRVYHNPDPEKGYTLDSVFVNSKADFQKNTITHILVTYTKEYRPITYLDTYNQLLSSESANYQNAPDVTPYNVLKVYINGVINREIQLKESELMENGAQFKLQIYPSSSDVKIYGLRTYKHPFTYAEVQKNYISSLLSSDAKKAFYDKNDILDDSGCISLRKCINKYNVLVYAIPTLDKPLYYANRKKEGDGESEATLLVHYADPTLANHNGRLWGGSYKAQGSSAKKYLIHNCQYNIKEGNFLSEEAIQKNVGLSESDADYTKPTNYYLMPGSDLEVKKLVGKVNYASSMQTHKQGACITYDDVYKQVFEASLDKAFPLGFGRKTCLENEFLYFYYNITPDQDLNTITIQDTLDGARFMGFQTWGSAKADDATYGYDKKRTPEYLLVEGADNGNPGANFKVPWAAFQTYDSTQTLANSTINQQLGDVTKKSHTAGLLIDDETIKYGVNNDPWDIDYGATKMQVATDSNPVYEFKSEVINTSLKHFVEFYNAMYKYDFTSLLPMTALGITNKGKFDVSGYSDYSRYKLYATGDITVLNSKNLTDKSVTNAKMWDVFRWDAVRNKWVPAGLHFGNTPEASGGTWETFNLETVYDTFKSDPLYIAGVAEGKIDTTKFKSISTKDESWFTNYLLPAMKELFAYACETYLDVDDVAFHQAMIRVLSGTDNRAKNTYFQIIGRVYEKDPETGEMIPIDSEDAYKIRLMQDDLDTILATDNNGQQNKEYFLLEPAFNKDTEGRWGDAHSAFFYPFDMCFSDKINRYTGSIIRYLIGTSSIESPETNLYKNFLRIQKYFPAIAYNHTAEIYYELAQTIYQGGVKLYDNGAFKSLLNDYVNNNVKDPLSLSHGSSYEGEVQFLNDRLLLLATLTKEGSGIQTSSQTLVNSGSGEKDKLFTVTGKAQYINYLYPNYKAASNNFVLILDNANSSGLNYDSLLKNSNVFGSDKYDKTVVKSLAIPGTVYDISLTGPTLTGFVLTNTDQYKYLEITSGLQELKSLITLLGASHVSIDGDTTNYKITTPEIQVFKHLPVIEELDLTNVTFNNSILDFRNCNRLRRLNLKGCSNITSIILPEGANLTEITLPNCIQDLTISNNPNLETIHFASGTRLRKLSINCDGVSSTLDINALINSYFDFSNATLLKLTGNCSLDISVVERMALLRDKIVLKGTYTILQDGVRANISYSLKKSLVVTFGNIDSEINNSHFIYEHIPLDKAVYEQLIQGLEFTEGASNTYYPFDSIYFEIGNDVLITSDGTLQIEYWLDPKAPAIVDATGKVTVSENSTSDYDYRVTIYSDYYGPITVSGQIQFGYIEPDINFYAYIDGTFSKSLVTSKKLVGRIFAKRINPQNSNEINLSILGTDTITGILGPDYYSHNGSTFSSQEQSLVFELLTTLYDAGADAKPPLTINNVSPYQNNDPQNIPKQLIGINTDTNQYPTRSGKSCTYAYYDKANDHIQRASEEYSTFKTSAYNAGLVDKLGKPINMNTETFNSLCEKFDSITGVINCRYSQILYPAFYKACLYEPIPLKTEAVSSLYKAGTWYVPSIEEMSILIAHRIKSTTTHTNNDQSVLDWNLTTYKDDSSLFFNKQNYTYFDGFLNQLGTTITKNGYSYITSDVNSNNAGNTILYGHDVSSYSNTNSAPIKWWGKFSNSAYINYNSYGQYFSTEDSLLCRRDQEYTVPLCCEITLTKKS